MPLTTQAKILRVLTDQSYTRVGGQRPVKVDVRVLSATSRNLAEEIAAGRFREDLYYRLNVVPVRLPPLARAARGYSRARQSLPRAVRRRTADSDARTVRGSDGRAPGARLAGQRPPAAQYHRADADPGAGRPGRLHRGRPAAGRDRRSAGVGSVSAPRRWRSWARPLREARESFEREYLKIQIRRFSGNISRTASFIGMERSALHRKLKALGLGDKRDMRNNDKMADKALSLQDHFLNTHPPIEDPGDDLPGEGRQAAGRDHLVRPLLAAAPARWQCAAGLQACHLDHHARRRRPTDLPGSRRGRAQRQEAGCCRTCSCSAAHASMEPMTVFLVNGVMLQGAVAGFDQFSLLLERGGQVQLVYKHAISTLQPAIRSTSAAKPHAGGGGD